MYHRLACETSHVASRIVSFPDPTLLEGGVWERDKVKNGGHVCTMGKMFSHRESFYAACIQVAGSIEMFVD